MEDSILNSLGSSSSLRDFKSSIVMISVSGSWYSSSGDRLLLLPKKEKRDDEGLEGGTDDGLHGPELRNDPVSGPFDKTTISPKIEFKLCVPYILYISFVIIFQLCNALVSRKLNS